VWFGRLRKFMCWIWMSNVFDEKQTTLGCLIYVDSRLRAEASYIIVQCLFYAFLSQSKGDNSGCNPSLT